MTTPAFLRRRTRLPFSAALLGATLLCVAAPAEATLIIGDFESGDLSGWTTYTTERGTLGGGFPRVEPFDTSGDGTPSLAAVFRVGAAEGPLVSWEGGGIFTDVPLGPGSLSISAAIAVLTDGAFDNRTGGLFELFFDGTLVDSHDFGSVAVDVPEFATLGAFIPSVTPGVHEVRFRVTRFASFQSPDTPRQYIDDVVLSGAAAVSEPGTLLLLAAGLLGSGLALRRRRPRR